MKIEYYTPSLQECVAIAQRCGSRESVAQIEKGRRAGLWQYLTAESVQSLREQLPFHKIENGNIL